MIKSVIIDELEKGTKEQRDAMKRLCLGYEGLPLIPFEKFYKEARADYDAVTKDLEDYLERKQKIENEYWNGNIEYPEAERSIEREAINRLFKYRRCEVLVAPILVYKGEANFYEERRKNLERIQGSKDRNMEK